MPPAADSRFVSFFVLRLAGLVALGKSSAHAAAYAAAMATATATAPAAATAKARVTTARAVNLAAAGLSRCTCTCQFLVFAATRDPVFRIRARACFLAILSTSGRCTKGRESDDDLAVVPAADAAGEGTLAVPAGHDSTPRRSAV